MEYLIYPEVGSCEIYGSDRFYEWCFGSTRKQHFVGNATGTAGPERMWENFSNDFHFGAMVTDDDTVRRCTMRC